jgi:prevent-host-death family protein
VINVNAADANRSFSKLLRQVAQGESFTVLSNGHPVATLAPARNQSGEQRQSRTTLLKRLSLEPVSDQSRAWTRDELYD